MRRGELGAQSPRCAPIDAPNPLSVLPKLFFNFPDQPTYLSPAPLYHAAPLRWCMTVHRMGGTVIVMEKFDPEACLADRAPPVRAYALRREHQ